MKERGTTMKISAMIGAPDLEKETLAVYSGDLQRAFGKIAALGYDGVELMTKNPGKLDGEKIRRSLEENGLVLTGLCTGHVYGEDRLGLVEADEGTRTKALTRFREFIDFAGTHFGSGTMVNIGRVRGMGYPKDRKRTLDEMARVFGELADYARPSGIRLVIEPITRNQTNFIITTRDGIRMVERVNRSNFGLMLDVYHMNIEDDDLYQSIREAGDTCWFVHFTDSDRKYPGNATLDFERIIRTLNETGYDGFVSMEIMPWPDPDTAARASIEYLRKYIPKESR
jgi:sugar phosphate isomerase/epimerase